MVKIKKSAQQPSKRIRKRAVPDPATTFQAAKRVTGEPVKYGSTGAVTEDSSEPLNRIQLTLTSYEEARAQLKMDYITDMDKRPLSWHLKRPDRNYESLLNYAKMKNMGIREGWGSARTRWYKSVEKLVFEGSQDKMAALRIKNWEELQQVEGYLMEWLMPVKDKNGEIKRDKKTGLPQFPLPLGNTEKVAKTVLMIQERMSLLAGDVTSRTEVFGSIESRNLNVNVDVSDPAAAMATLNREEASILARKLQLMRSTRLASSLLPETIEAQQESSNEEDNIEKVCSNK